MIKVALHGMSFFAYHGFYPEEQLIGNHFLLDVEVEFEQNSPFNDSITHTVNYESLYTIVKAEMQQPRKLLETVAEAINSRVLAAFPFAATVCTGITKLNPPLAGQVASSFVQIKYSKHHELQ